MNFQYFEAVDHVVTYCKVRPSPPKLLIERIVTFLKEGHGSAHSAADVGCGSGQSTIALSPHFDNVIGLEPSEEAVKQASLCNQLPNVLYKVSSAEILELEDDWVDLVYAVQAVHWFDKPKFYSEVDRVLKSHGVLALVGYCLPEIKTQNASTALSSLIKKYYLEVLKDYVLPESRQVYLENYRDPVFNDVYFVENGKMIREEGFVTEIAVTLQDISGYISSWSGFQNFTRKEGEEAGKKVLQQFEDEFLKLFKGNADSPITIQYNYFVLLGKKSN